MTKDLQNISDKDLVEQIKMDNQMVWTYFFDSRKAKLFNFTKKIVADRHEAKAIVTHAFSVLWELKDNFETRNDMEALLYTVCRREAYDFNMYKYKGGKARSLEILTEDISKIVKETYENITILNQIYETERIAQLYQMIGKLSPQSEKIIRLLIEEKSLEEIAELLNISYDAAKMRKVRAVKELQGKIAGTEMMTLAMLLTIRQLLFN